MWSGVIVMIRVITIWPTSSATIAASTVGRWSRNASEGPEAAGAELLAPSSGSRRIARGPPSANWYGSGRSRRNERSAAAPTNKAGTRYGPASAGSPIAVATGPAGPTRLGPITAPIVAPQTTVAMAEARRAMGNMSAAV